MSEIDMNEEFEMNTNPEAAQQAADELHAIANETAANPQSDSATSDSHNDVPTDLITDADAIEQALEAIIFAAPRALSFLKIRNLMSKMKYDVSELKEYIESLRQKYESRGIQLVPVAGGYQFRTHPAQRDLVEKLVEEKPVRLSGSALEVLSIVAYKQPITRAEIDVVRGVDSGHLVKGLLEKNLVRIVGHAESPGRPLLYQTTPYFLEVFSLGELEDLPSLDEFQRELISQGGEASVLEAMPGEVPSQLAANPDRGAFDDVAIEDFDSPDFGESNSDTDPLELAQS